MGKAMTEAAEWLSKEPATDWGNHEWRLFNVIEEAEALQAENTLLWEYYNAVGAIGEPTYSYQQIERVNAARAALQQDKEGE